MAKAPRSEKDWKQLEREFREIKERSREQFTAPRYPTRTIVDQLKVPRSTVVNWLARSSFTLDADQHRQNGRNRLFSPRDCFLIAATERFVSLGMPFELAKEIAQRICNQTMEQMIAIRASIAADTVLVIFKDAGKWRVERKDDVSDIVPPARIEFDVDAFVDETFNVLGIATALGSADSVRRRAAEPRQSESEPE